MRACRHDISENISENIFEDIFKEIASAAHADRGAPHHLVALGVVRRHLPSLLSLAPPRSLAPLFHSIWESKPFSPKTAAAGLGGTGRS